MVRCAGRGGGAISEPGTVVGFSGRGGGVSEASSVVGFPGRGGGVSEAGSGKSSSRGRIVAVSETAMRGASGFSS